MSRDSVARNSTILLASLFGAWCVISLLTAAYTELSADECHYWFVSQNLDWGYFDHPPLFAVFAHIGTLFFGDTPLGVRALTAIAMPLALFLFWFVIRNDKSDVRSAVTYFLASFSVPILHLYGFVATCDAPLILATVITLIAFRLYLNGKLTGVLLLGIGFALMGYAKYHGALVMLVLIASRPKMLIDWRFYIACAVALMLLLPHLYWQYTHDWISVYYYSIEVFSWSAVWEYLGNFIVTFNPFLVIPFMILLFKNQKFPDKITHSMKFLFWGFFLFFLLSTYRGHVQIQWVIVAVLPMLFMVVRKAQISRAFTRYVRFSSVIFGGILLCVHVFAMINTKDFLPQADIFGNREVIEKHQADFDSVEMVITSGSYQMASKLNFYGKIPAYAMPNLYSRSSQYEFVDMDTPMYGHRVAQEIGTNQYLLPVDTLVARHRKAVLPHGGVMFFDVVESYIPTRKVEIEIETFPAKILTDSRLALLLKIENPYDFDIKLGGKDGFLIVMNLARRGEVIDIELPFKEQVLGASSRLNIATTVVIPVVETGDFKVGITLCKPPYSSWYNSKVYNLGIINPKTQI